MFDVSAIKIMKSSFLFFTATLFVSSSIFFTCFSMIVSHLSSAFAARSTDSVATVSCHFSMEAVILSDVASRAAASLAFLLPTGRPSVSHCLQWCVQINDTLAALLQKRPRLPPFLTLPKQDEAVYQLELLLHVDDVPLQCPLQLGGGVDAALLPCLDVFKEAVKEIDGVLDVSPTRRHRLLSAPHVHIVVLFVDDLALVKLHLDPLSISAAGWRQ
jgi:hypothetical protein